jgi:hypothetical protein
MVKYHNIQFVVEILTDGFKEIHFWKSLEFLLELFFVKFSLLQN